MSDLMWGFAILITGLMCAGFMRCHVRELARLSNGPHGRRVLFWARVVVTVVIGYLITVWQMLLGMVKIVWAIAGA